MRQQSNCLFRFENVIVPLAMETLATKGWDEISNRSSNRFTLKVGSRSVPS